MRAGEARGLGMVVVVVSIQGNPGIPTGGGNGGGGKHPGGGYPPGGNPQGFCVHKFNLNMMIVKTLVKYRKKQDSPHLIQIPTVQQNMQRKKSA